MKTIETLIKEALSKRLLFTPHCAEQMNKPDRLISIAEVREVIKSGKTIEDYPEDKRGHSCLMMGYTSQNRLLHIVCSPKDEYLAVITAYVPDPLIWDATFAKRKKG